MSNYIVRRDPDYSYAWVELMTLKIGDVVSVNDSELGIVFGVVTANNSADTNPIVKWDNSGTMTTLHEGMYEVVTTVHQRAVRLQKLKIIGNAADDANLLNLAHEIIVSNEASYEQKIAALKRIDEAMGCESEYSQAAIDNYIAETTGDEIDQANFDEWLGNVDIDDIRPADRVFTDQPYDAFDEWMNNE